MLSETSPLVHEWTTLQNNYEQCERNSILIRLVSAVLFVACLVLPLDAVIPIAVMVILWVQEGILRTGQSRLGDRLLRIEQMLRQASPQVAYACQLHTEWQAGRPGFAGLLAEYAKSMLKPTVAFHYVILALLSLGAAVTR